MALWLSNSLYSFIGIFIKVYQFFKDRARAKRVQDIKKNEKDIVVTNLEV